MKTERFSVQACCGKTSVILKTDTPLTIEHLRRLVEFGYTESKHFTQAGLIYADNSDFILSGPLGSDRLQIKCKKPGCEDKIPDLEALLTKIG
jgi:hypothetical protein